VNQFSPRGWGWPRHIDMHDIVYVALGHNTPAFKSRADQLDPDTCLSVVGKQQILDIQAHSPDVALLWCKGLRRLINQSDEDAERLAKEQYRKKSLPACPGRAAAAAAPTGSSQKCQRLSLGIDVALFMRSSLYLLKRVQVVSFQRFYSMHARESR